MTIPTYTTTNDTHQMVITTETITAANVRRILVSEFGYEVKAVYRDGQVARIEDQGRSEWVFIFTSEDAKLLTFESAPIKEPTMTSAKEIVYDRETRDYAMYYEGALVGFAKTYQVAETELDTYVYELLRHTAVESADQAADVAALATEAIIADDDLPLAARAIPLAPGAHELDDGDVKAAYWAALAHPEMQPQRWQTALNKAFTHLDEDHFVVAINNHGAYCWWADDDKGGDYAVTPATCSCTAFCKDWPCRHRAAAILLSLLPVAEEKGVGSEIEEAYRLIMWDVERCAA